jgi:hypothetical protein
MEKTGVVDCSSRMASDAEKGSFMFGLKTSRLGMAEKQPAQHFART